MAKWYRAVRGVALVAGLAALALGLSACSDGGDDIQASAPTNQTKAPGASAAKANTVQANATGVKPKGPYSDASLTPPPDATKGGVFGPDYAPDNSTQGANQTAPQPQQR